MNIGLFEAHTYFRYDSTEPDGLCVCVVVEVFCRFSMSMFSALFMLGIKSCMMNDINIDFDCTADKKRSGGQTLRPIFFLF